MKPTPPEPRGRRVELRPGLALSCVEQGAASGPAVVLLHGPTDSCRSYEPVLPYVPARLHVIAISQRGHGDSDTPAGPFGVRALAGDVVDVMDALGLERAVLAGHSAAGLVARRVAIDHPERVSGLVLEASPVSLAGDPALVDLVTSVIDDLEDPIGPAFVRSFVTDTSSDALPPDLLETLVVEACKAPARVWRDLFGDLLTYDDAPELADVRAPALLVWGDADPLVRREAQDRLARLLPDAELVVYAGAGHTPRWEEPRRFAGDLARFVAAVDVDDARPPGELVAPRLAQVRTPARGPATSTGVASPRPVSGVRRGRPSGARGPEPAGRWSRPPRRMSPP